MIRIQRAVFGVVCHDRDLPHMQLSKHVRQSLIQRLVNGAKQALTQWVEAFAEYVAQQVSKYHAAVNTCATMTDAIDITLDNLSADRQLKYGNYQVVSALQALWGAITSNMIAISLRCVGPEVHLHLNLREASKFDTKIINEAAEDLESLKFTSVPIHTHIKVASESLVHRQAAGLIFRRYEP